MKKITKQDLEFLALGSTILGSGGGGDPGQDLLAAQFHLETYGPTTIISIDELKENDLVVPVAFMGAPSVGMEKLSSGSEFDYIFAEIEKIYGKKPTVLMPAEIGGSNAFVPFTIASKLKLPILDADSMGRAFPKLEMSSFNLFDIAPTPAFLADSQGNSVVITTRNNVDNALMLEEIARQVTISLGSSAALSMYLMNGNQAKKAVVPGTITQAIEIGKILKQAQLQGKNPAQVLCNNMRGTILITGIIEDIEQKIENGFLKGSATIIDDQQNNVSIKYQNENLIAVFNKQIIATTPDIIIPIDAENGTPITTESLKYGLRVSILLLPSPEIWATKKGLKLVGPHVFGYKTNFIPFNQLKEKDE